ncbi:Fanconi anemia group E protein [Tachyglossus aculeatus]|uniref:Fanconi anemia group E protein n=1 Tax=Tachyglossus aculeatus TaxID=9261 RepID=UPI0018F5A18F|nr:Fanconi anemia group E protein [Tachyglossus aculeatus]
MNEWRLNGQSAPPPPGHAPNIRQTLATPPTQATPTTQTTLLRKTRPRRRPLALATPTTHAHDGSHAHDARPNPGRAHDASHAPRQTTPPTRVPGPAPHGHAHDAQQSSGHAHGSRHAHDAGPYPRLATPTTLAQTLATPPTQTTPTTLAPSPAPHGLAHDARPNPGHAPTQATPMTLAPTPPPSWPRPRRTLTTQATPTTHAQTPPPGVWEGGREAGPPPPPWRAPRALRAPRAPRAPPRPPCPPLLPRPPCPPRSVLGLGPLRALGAVRRLGLRPLLQALGRPEPDPEPGPARGPLPTTPLLLQLPPVCQANLLALLLATRPALPRPAVRSLLQLVRCPSASDPWLRALGDLLGRELGEAEEGASLLTAECREQLRGLCRTLRGPDRGLGPNRAEVSVEAAEDMGSQSYRRGRKGLEREDDSQEGERPPKRPRVQEGEEEGGSPGEGPSAVAGQEGGSPSGAGESEEDSISLGAVDGEACGRPGETLDLPQDIKGLVSQLLEIEWEGPLGSPPTDLHLLHQCFPHQLEAVCEQLRLCQLPDTAIYQLSTWLLALAPDLSSSSATVLAQSLFLDKILSLTAPASRVLTAALSAFCTKYPHAIGLGLFRPLLLSPATGPLQTGLLCQLMEKTLEPEQLILMLSLALDLPWTEATFPLLQTLLGQQLALPPETLDQLLGQLCCQTPVFASSVAFSRLVLTVLTQYRSHITETQKLSLAAALQLNTTFLRKTLLTVLGCPPASSKAPLPS